VVKQTKPAKRSRKPASGPSLATSADASRGSKPSANEPEKVAQQGKPLVAAVDALVAFAWANHCKPLLLPERVQELQALDAKVYLEAQRAGVQIPAVATGQDRFGWTGLSVVGLGSVGVPGFGPVPGVTEDWQQAMDALRATAEVTEPAGPWSEPDGPSQWARRFRYSVDTLKRRVNKGAIRIKVLSSKSWQIHVDDLPKTGNL